MFQPATLQGFPTPRVASFADPTASHRRPAPPMASLSDYLTGSYVSLEQRPRSASLMQPAVSDMNLPLSVGDVICVKGTPDGITRLGATGGFMGHVLLVMAPPKGIHKYSAEALRFQQIWPKNTGMLWVVSTGESSRAAEGFIETDHLMYINGSGHVLLIGEIAKEREFALVKYEEPTRVQLFCCPNELQAYYRPDIMNGVLAKLRKREASWSWGTAIRAFLFSADVSEHQDADEMLEEIKRCWNSDPICTSVVIVFWQQYMCELANCQEDSHAMDWILQWMPVKADRALPGDLLSTMQRCGWEVIESIDGRNRTSSFSVKL
jgi:hypothetical protein